MNSQTYKKKIRTWSIVVILILATIFLMLQLSATPDAEESSSFISDEAIVNAVFENSTETVDSLLRSGANVNAQLPNSQTLLQFATSGRNIEMIRTLIRGSSSADPYSSLDPGLPTPAELADDDPELLGALLSKYSESMDECDELGFTPLMYAAARDDARTVLVLVSARTNLEQTCGGGHTALAIAVALNANAALRVLGNSNADYYSRSPKGLRPMDVARHAHNSLALKVLGKRSAEIDAAIVSGRARHGIAKGLSHSYNFDDYRLAMDGAPLPPLFSDVGATVIETDEIKIDVGIPKPSKPAESDDRFLTN
ncbi:MAG TPA: ankyrin repeat domain-containing protein [Steroidobacteraceae bacterium]|nr:ankyrin repeat domain-containing protein [Steroidobacteraceae bacterium]